MKRLVRPLVGRPAGSGNLVRPNAQFSRSRYPWSASGVQREGPTTLGDFDPDGVLGAGPQPLGARFATVLLG